jgi:uncharacterized protein YneF (UPF0154 family)
MSFEDEMRFLMQIQQCVKNDPELTQKIIRACMDGTEERLQQEVQLRVDAEFALSMAHSMISQSQMDKNPAYEAKILRVLINSGAFSGTPFAEGAQLRLKDERLKRVR